MYAFPNLSIIFLAHPLAVTVLVVEHGYFCEYSCMKTKFAI
jgi:hypothetical protein